MGTVERFYDAVQKEMTATLATAAEGSVTMRTVSPVRFGDAILIFTADSSQKYRQLQQNPHCCVAVGAFFAEAAAEFRGATLLPENADLRAAYNQKFPGAFDEGIAFGGRDAAFVLLHPVRLTGWEFADGVPTEDGIPNMPFAVQL